LQVPLLVDHSRVNPQLVDCTLVSVAHA
jgi:hypothetical protein